MTPLLSAFVLAASTFATPPVLSTPAACASVPAPVEQASFDFDNGGETVNADCTAYCGSSPPVSCSGSTCVAVDQSCPSQRGYATCDGVTYYCPVCSTTPICTEGSYKTVITGPYCSCEDGMTTPRDRYQCINGQWEYLYSFCGGPFCQGY